MYIYIYIYTYKHIRIFLNNYIYIYIYTHVNIYNKQTIHTRVSRMAGHGGGIQILKTVFCKHRDIITGNVDTTVGITIDTQQR